MAALVAQFGSPASTLANVDEIRIFHNPDPVFAGPPAAIPTVNAVVGVDDIAALAAVPEPGRLLFTGSALGLLALVRRRRRQV